MTPPPGGAAEDVPPGGRGDRFVVARLGAGLVTLMLVSAYMQYTLSVLGPVLIDRFLLSRTQLGLLTSILFLIGGVGSPIVGRITDRVGARRLLVFPFAANIVAFLLLAAAGSYAGLVAAVIVAGMGMTFATPLTNHLIAVHVPRDRQGLLMGIKQSGVQVAAALAGVAMPAALVLGGLVAAGVGTSVAMAGGLLLVLGSVPRVRPRHSGGSDRAGTEHLGNLPGADDTARDAVDGAGPAHDRRTTLLWIGSYAVLMGSGIAAVYAYLPLFAVSELEMSVGGAGLVASVLGLLGIVSRVVWGVVSDRLRHPSVALAILSATAVVAQLLLWSSPRLGVTALWSAAALLGVSAVAWNTVAMLALIRVLGARTAGADSGLVQLAFFAGFAIGPPLFGLVTDAVGTYDLGWALIALAFALATTISGHWVRRTRHDDPARLPG